MQRVMLYPFYGETSGYLSRFNELFPFEITGGIDSGGDIKVHSLVDQFDTQSLKSVSDLPKIVEYADTLLLTDTFFNDEGLNKWKEVLKAVHEAGMQISIPEVLFEPGLKLFCEDQGIKPCILNNENDTLRKEKESKIYGINLNSFGTSDDISIQLAIVRNLRRKGYRVNLQFAHKVLSSLIPFQNDPDIIINGNAYAQVHILAVDEKRCMDDVIGSAEGQIYSALVMWSENQDSDKSVYSQCLPVFNLAQVSGMEKFIGFLKEKFLQCMNLTEILNKDRERFLQEDLDQFHCFRIDDNHFLFEAGSRFCWNIGKEIYKFLEYYFNQNCVSFHELNKEFDYESIIAKYEAFHSIRFDSQVRNRKIKAYIAGNPTLHSGGTTFSFLGSRKCNLQCKYCFVDTSKVEKPEDNLSEEAMRAGLEYAIKNSENSQKISVDYSLGGEPMLSFETYKKLWALCKEYDSISDKEVALGFITNGTLLSDEAIEWFNNNHHWMGFSLDGGKEAHDSMRVFADGRGSFEKAIPQVKKVLDLKWEHDPGANVVLTAKNPDVLHNFLDLWDMGFRVITTRPVRADGDLDFAITMKNIHVIKDSYHRFASFIIKQAKENKNIEYLKAILNPFDFFGRFLLRVFMRDRIILKRCPGGTKIFSMRNNGDVYPCDSFNGMDEFKLGNVIEGTVDPSKFNPPKVTEMDKCSKCWARYLCGGLCTYTLFLNNGKPDSASDAECELVRHLIMMSCNVWWEIREAFTKEEIEEINKFILLQTCGVSW